MQLGIGSYAYRWAIRAGRMDLTAFIDKSRRAGAQCLQICDNLPLIRKTDAELEDLRRQSVDLGLALEIGTVGSELTHLRRYIAITAALGARILRVVTADGPSRPSADQLVTICRAILPELHASGVTLAIENHFDLVPREVARVIETVNDPAVGVCLDPLNSISLLVGPEETVATLLPHTLSVHIKDATVRR